MANRLARETSPYLRQHAGNPVDWYPWGEEAFAEARRRDVPVLLSVGYSSCHWCHVMAHESFEDPDTAAVMNELFVNVKVDREERPDVDAIYMEAVQAMTGHGGWPMTVFLTPDGRPFFGGTYFPRTARGGMIAFTDLLARIAQVWRERRDDVVGQAHELTEAISRTSRLQPGEDLPGSEALRAAGAELRRQFDPEWGGFGRAPKFPQGMSLDLLLRLHVHDRSPETLEMVTTSLDAMASGGIYDHLGGGFARYSTDASWLVPHFEKMLYDQALLARVYLHAWQLTGEPRYRQVVEETVGYVLRDLRHPEGGFYSAEDADSEGVEGKFYVWTDAQIRSVLGDDADAAIEWWGVTPRGNWEGTNILWRPVRGDLIRPEVIEAARQRLFEARRVRVRPGLDDKVLTEWNGLMLATLAEAAAATGNASWLSAADANAEFLLEHLRGDGGRWMRSWQAEGGARHLAVAADYGALLDAFVRLAEATGRARWIDEARAVADGLLERFWDRECGGVFTTGDDAEPLVTRPKDLMDNATPSANSLVANGLLRLAALTGEVRYHERAETILRLLGDLVARHPTAFGHLLAAVDLLATGPTEIAVVGDRPDLLGEVRSRFLPNVVLAWGEPYDSPLWEGRTGHDGTGRAYVCRHYTCLAPVTTAEALAAQLA
ncbi:thioredoxin domain-containing protein [Rhabdothermincola sediminis]|uniref:thioredoxin domain-containing protein n=1 Tax=Rhabdothermincola sediminis TaxID=2751370 RepID=UPI001AA03C13|nr:thioredoxin domain-containing protein [Rhabdothermincola sediminis]